MLITFVEFLYVKEEGICRTWFSPDIEGGDLQTLKRRCSKISDCIGIEDNGCAFGCLTDYQFHLCKGTPRSTREAIFNAISGGIQNFFEVAGNLLIYLGYYFGITGQKYVYTRAGNLTLRINTILTNFFA